MQASVCAPTTRSRPTPRSDNTDSSGVSSNESPYRFSTSGSVSAGVNSATIRQSSLPLTRCSLECCTQTTGTCSRRAFSTRLPTFATTSSRPGAPSTTPRCTSTTSSAVFGRSASVVIDVRAPRLHAVAKRLCLWEALELLERVVLDLPDSLARDTESLADLLEGARLAAGQAEAQLDHLSLARRQ